MIYLTTFLKILKYQYVIYQIIFNNKETALNIAWEKNYQHVVKILLLSDKINECSR